LNGTASDFDAAMVQFGLASAGAFAARAFGHKSDDDAPHLPQAVWSQEDVACAEVCYHQLRGQ
jgi:hypothetical protein